MVKVVNILIIFLSNILFQTAFCTVNNDSTANDQDIVTVYPNDLSNPLLILGIGAAAAGGLGLYHLNFQSYEDFATRLSDFRTGIEASLSLTGIIWGSVAIAVAINQKIFPQPFIKLDSHGIHWGETSIKWNELSDIYIEKKFVISESHIVEKPAIILVAHKDDNSKMLIKVKEEYLPITVLQFLELVKDFLGK